MGAGGSRELRGTSFLFVGQERCFQDDLAHRIAIDTILDHGPDVTQHERIVAAFERADVYHHIDLAGAITNSATRFYRLDRGLIGAEWETDDRAGEHLAASQQLSRQ